MPVKEGELILAIVEPDEVSVWMHQSVEELPDPTGAARSERL